MTELSLSIDGPTASGKSTLATALARELGLAFLDTGLTYRSLAFALDHESAGTLAADLGSLLVHRPEVYARDGRGVPLQRHVILFRGQDITDRIHHASLDGNLKAVAQNPACRAAILELHRSIAEKHQKIVAVGRDVATSLLTGASLHVYLTASESVRGERRRAQYRNNPDRSIKVGPATALDLENRDAIRALPNSLDLDSTYLPVDAVRKATLRELGKYAA
ncbi:(d)CMP kinase [Streptomyces sp. NPDC059070]|uniref:(d)CMP kinase n=1 Tax=Streptomyces sp. NPDC059070 TaxID=3346713 RepID=UPI0036A069A9